MSNLVLAEKWELKVPVGIKAGTWKTDGHKELKVSKKLVSRHYVLSRIEAGKMYNEKGNLIENVRSNNELYKLFEDETKELMKVREENIIKNAEKDRKNKMGMSDLVDAVNKTPEKLIKKPKKVVESNSELDRLRVLCDEEGIKYHHAAKESKLKELLNA